MTNPIILTQSDLYGLTDNQQHMLIELVGHEGHVTVDVYRGKITLAEAAEVLRRAADVTERRGRAKGEIV